MTIPPASGVKPNIAPPKPSTKYELRFTVSEEVMKKYQEVQALLSGKYPREIRMETLLDEVLEIFLERKSPKRRQERRVKRAEKKQEAQEVVQSPSKSRYIPQAVKDRVFLRDGGRCTFVSAEGVRCDSRHDLEVDHIVPFGKGGSRNISNLRMLCSCHNQYAAYKEYGEAHMKTFVNDAG